MPEYEEKSINTIKKALLTTSTSNIQLAANTTIPFKVYAINSKEAKDITKDAVIETNSEFFTFGDKTITTHKLDDKPNKNAAYTISIPNKANPFNSYKGSGNIQIVDIPICGNGLGRGDGVNDTDQNNITGPCIKSIKAADKDNKPIWFSSSPSEEMVNALGYTVSTTRPSDKNAKNYKELAHEGNQLQPSYGFPAFSQLSTNNDGKDGQYEYWCKDLNNKKFAGKSNWSRASVEQINILFSKLKIKKIGSETNAISINDYGWPILFGLWTNTPAETDNELAVIYNYVSGGKENVIHSKSLDTSEFVTCVSVAE